MCTYEERTGKELKQEEVEAGTQKLKELLEAADFKRAKEVKVCIKYSSYLEKCFLCNYVKISIDVSELKMSLFHQFTLYASCSNSVHWYPSIFLRVPTLHRNSSFLLLLSIFLSQIHQKCEEGVEDIEKLGIPSAVQLMLSSSDKNTQQLIAEAQKEFESTYFLFYFVLRVRDN